MRPARYSILVFLVCLLAVALVDVAVGSPFRPGSAVTIAGSIAITIYVYHRYESE